MASKNRYKFIDELNAKLGLTRDDHLARRLGVTNGVISKIRTRAINVSPEIILKVYDATGWSIEEIRRLIKES